MPNGSQGLRQVLQTRDFSAWEAAVASSLGHHSSRLLSRASAFGACFHWGQAGPVQLQHLRGRGVVELDREQVGNAVLWIPLRGRSQERLNGQQLLISPGEALLIRPGDQLRGRTDAELEGLSLVLPAAGFSAAAAGPCLLGGEPGQRRLIAQAGLLHKAIAWRDPSRAIAARELLERLEELVAAAAAPVPRPSLGQRRRWQLVQEAEHWMGARLDQPFSIGELATALACPQRTLHDAFARELGRSPLARARQLRLRALRQSLQDPSLSSHSIAELMGRSGLLACGATARAYAACYGELPRRTRARSQTRATEDQIKKQTKLSAL